MIGQSNRLFLSWWRIVGGKIGDGRPQVKWESLIEEDQNRTLDKMKIEGSDKGSDDIDQNESNNPTEDKKGVPNWVIYIITRIGRV